ncbi:MerR family transcriptional regulator [Streptomyces sp. N2-109]|uniref:MerR family transcriptional regulator n=1 Tax=Streptomyces gossypii TaxID=2883101 RepID=A0ABT2JQU6_9ACTN|nr:MerR family transcriptional regulator [Streptomyces gossypii]MCT2590263.1 MerR family transcriptional regulator [Streptomyces gossypii]
MSLMDTETQTETDQELYAISEVAARTGLSPHTLRWYERIGLMPYASRSHTGQRRFTERDLRWLALVGKLRLTGMPVAAMVRYAELVRAGSGTLGERQELLEATRREVEQRIAELQDSLTVLNFKIDNYAEARTRARAEEHAERPEQTPRAAQPRQPGQSRSSNGKRQCT